MRAREIDGSERKKRVGKIGRLPKTCLKTKVWSWHG